MAAEAASSFEGAALGWGVLAAVVIVLELAVAGLLRTGVVGPMDGPFRVSGQGLIDLVALIAAVCLSPSARYRTTPLLWLIVVAVGWSGLMIPARPALRYAATSWPEWMPSTLWIFAGVSLALSGFVAIQGVLHQHRRKRAWPDHLEWLCEPHDPGPGFRPSAAALAMGLLPLGAYHAASFFVAAGAALAGGSSLQLARRQWHPNFAEVGMALVTLAVVSFAVACVPDSVGGANLTTRMPLLLAAAIVGLAVMVFMWQWLPNVWDQQLHDGRAWTTTGRMIPLARRMGLIVAAFGVLAGSQLAFWPEIASVRDDSVGRWVVGSLAYAVLLGALVLATRLSQRKHLAALSLLGLAVVGVFAALRFPETRLEFWLLEHWPIMVACVAPICLALSRLSDRGRWRPFTDLLEKMALVLVPAVALAGTVAASFHPVAPLRSKLIRYDPVTLRTWTWAILAVLYALHAGAPARRSLSLAAAVLLNGAIANLALSCGWDPVGQSYGYLMPVAASLIVLAYVNRSRLSEAAFRGIRLGGAFLLLASPAWRLFVPGVQDFAVLSIVLVLGSVSLLVVGLLLRTRIFIYMGLAGGCVELIAQVARLATKTAS